MKKFFINLRQFTWIFITLIFVMGNLFAQTNSKISGTVTDQSTGEPLSGANILIEGTTLGAAADENGQYFILNVPPGDRTVRAQMIGYNTVVKSNIKVLIDLTTTVDFELQVEAVGGEEVVVTAERPVVQPDVSANVANIDKKEIVNVPVAGISEFINLQAGIEPGLQVRGAGLDQVGLLLDGSSTRDVRSNRPYTNISVTSVEEFQVQTGGFSAEYGNVRSGLINVVTKEGSRDRYNADILIRYISPQEKYFGGLPFDRDNFYIRSYLDPDIAFVGTQKNNYGVMATPAREDSIWDRYTERSFPQFEGWDAVSSKKRSNNDSTDDVTSEQAQQIWLFETRMLDTAATRREGKSVLIPEDQHRLNIDDPDYELDLTVTGPVPILSKPLGDLRFATSYRRTQTAYIVPQFREFYYDQTARIKLTSDIVPGKMKLSLHGHYAEEHGINGETGGGDPNLLTGTMPSYPWHGFQNKFEYNDLIANLWGGQLAYFATNVFVPLEITRNTFGVDFTHTLSPKTFYKVRLQRASTQYKSIPEPEVDRSVILWQVGPVKLDNAPFGQRQLIEPGDSRSGNGWRIGGHMGSQRDTSEVSIWTFNVDLTSQVNHFMLVKTGLEYNYNDHNIRHGEVDPVFTHHTNPKFNYHRQPIQAAAYGQSKFEFQGMIANMGLRLDYYDPSGEWYIFDQYDEALSDTSGYQNLDTNLTQQPVEKQVSLSPRLGVSFPITVNSKLYFNYGHFRQMLVPREIFEVQGNNDNSVGRIADPNRPLPLTVQYELGYDHNLFNQYLLRVTGYYKRLSFQNRNVTFVNNNEDLDYALRTPFNYEDNRGFEITLNKVRGKWARGFFNFTFLQKKTGNFGKPVYYENELKQLREDHISEAHYLNRPVSEPFARGNLELLTPIGYGPQIAGLTPLSDWRLDLLGEWRSGLTFTYTGRESIEKLSNNVKWKDYWNLDLRLSKNVDFKFAQAQFFVDVENLLNLKHLSRGFGFAGTNDDHYYLESIHWPENTFKDKEGNDLRPVDFVPGNDRPGDFRDPSVEWVPIEVVFEKEALPDDPGFLEPGRRVLYYVEDTKTYMEYQNDAWNKADQGFVDQILKDKAYIDMPNATYFNFLSPRSIHFGVRLTF